MRYPLFLIAALYPAFVWGDVEGVRLVFRDPTPVTRAAGHLMWGDGLVGITSEAQSHHPHVFSIEGAPRYSVPHGGISSGAIAGGQIYLGSASLGGIAMFDSQTGRKLGLISQRQAERIMRIAASPDGETIALYRALLPSIEIYARNAETGGLVRTSVFQPNEEALSFLRSQARQFPAAYSFTLDPDAVRLAHLKPPSGMAFSRDSKHLFVTSLSALHVFSRNGHGWEHCCTAKDGERGLITMGLQVTHCVAAHNRHVFVGGKQFLSRFRYEGKKLVYVKHWIDDASLFEELPRLEFIDDVMSLALSANGEYLFMASQPEEKIHVMQVTANDLAYHGSIPAARPGNQALDVVVPPDGRRLFARTTGCQLLIYELDERFWKSRSE